VVSCRTALKSFFYFILGWTSAGGLLKPNADQIVVSRASDWIRLQAHHQLNNLLSNRQVNKNKSEYSWFLAEQPCNGFSFQAEQEWETLLNGTEIETWVLEHAAGWD